MDIKLSDKANSTDEVQNEKVKKSYDIMRPTDLAAAHQYDKVVSVITKAPEERSNTEIHQIKSWFKKKSDLFNQLNDEIINDLIKNCEFTSVERDFVILKQGEKGDCFFIILNGSVAILINTTFGLEDDRPEEADKIEKPRERKLSIRRHSKENQETETPNELDRSKFGNYVGKIESGKSFGELALINTDCVRNATIIADEATDLIVIDRDLYNRCIRAFHAKEFAERKSFVEKHPLFKRWHPKYKKQMSMSLRKERHNFESVIVKQGSVFDGLRFILSGQTKLTADPHYHSLQYIDYYPLPDVEHLEKVEARESLRRELCMNSQKLGEYKSTVPNRQKIATNEASRKRSPKQVGQRHIELCLIGSEEIVGDMEVAMDLHTYSYSIKCIQETEIYVLDLQNYERLIEKRNPQVIDMIRSSVLEKYSLRLSWIQDKKEIPLFRYLLYKIVETDRKKLLKKEDILRREKERITPDDWDVSTLKKGPLIDMFGPGSVFYAIRMKAKQREMDRLSYKARVDRRRVVNDKTKRQTPSPGNIQGATTTGLVTQVIKSRHDMENGGADLTNEDGIDLDLHDVTRSRLLCSKEGHLSSEGKNQIDDEFEDWESSDANLSKLENRLQKWYGHFEENQPKKQETSVVKLRRYHSEAPGKPPLPGKKIFIRSKSRQAPVLLEDLKRTLDDDQHITRMYSAPARVKCHSAPPVFRQGAGEFLSVKVRTNHCISCAETMTSPSRSPRPASSYRSVFTPTICLRRKRPQTAHQYTAQEYEALKAEMKRRQRSYKSMYYDRPASAYI